MSWLCSSEKQYLWCCNRQKYKLFFCCFFNPNPHGPLLLFLPDYPLGKGAEVLFLSYSTVWDSEEGSHNYQEWIEMKSLPCRALAGGRAKRSSLSCITSKSQWVVTFRSTHMQMCMRMYILLSKSMAWLGRAGLELGELPTAWCQLVENKEMTHSQWCSFNQK